MKSVFKLDPASDRYRVCPNCKKPHMVTHRGRDFCSKKCNDEYNNQLKKLLKQSQTIVAEQKESPVPVMASGGIVPSAPETGSTWEDGMKTNLAILDRLGLDEKHGSVYSIDDLDANGFKFGVYSTQGKNHNLPSGVQSTFVIYKNYRMYRVDYSKVLIKKIN